MNDELCHQHQAAASVGKSKDPSTDIKGIGSVACARHGCFAAGGTVNIKLGEKSDMFLFIILGR
jgi:hypothetical protein